MDTMKYFHFFFVFIIIFFFNFRFLFHYYDKFCLLDNNIDHCRCIRNILDPVRAKQTLKPNDNDNLLYGYNLCLFLLLSETKLVSFDRKHLFLDSYYHLLYLYFDRRYFLVIDQYFFSILIQFYVRIFFRFRELYWM